MRSLRFENNDTAHNDLILRFAGDLSERPRGFRVDGPTVRYNLPELIAAVRGSLAPESFGGGGLLVVQSLEEIETWLGRPLPEAYRTFLAATAESFLAANNGTLVYGRNDVVERNDTYQSRTYCPGHLMVGDDSGGTALVLSLADGLIHSVGMGSMTPDCFEPVASSFPAWQAAGFPHAE